MIFEINKRFAKQFDSLLDKKLAVAINVAIEEVGKAKAINQIPEIKKLKGFKTAYRIRVGNYRIGVIVENNIVYFMTFYHRKEIYKYFP